MTYQSCAAPILGGATVTISGSLTTSIEYRYDHFGQFISADGSQEGSLTWTLGGRSGSCLLDLEISMADAEAGFNLRGTACEINIDQEVST